MCSILPLAYMSEVNVEYRFEKCFILCTFLLYVFYYSMYSIILQNDSIFSIALGSFNM